MVIGVYLSLYIYPPLFRCLFHHKVFRFEHLDVFIQLFSIRNVVASKLLHCCLLRTMPVVSDVYMYWPVWGQQQSE